MSENKLIVMVAPPGAGKSTLSEKLVAQDSSTFIVSTDSIREELLGSASNQAKGDIVFKTAYQRAEFLLKAGNSVIFDSTAAKPIYRKNLIDIANRVGVPAICYHFDVPLELCFERNRGRIRFVPHNIIEGMWNNIKKSPPRLDEGFSEIIEIFE